MYAWDHNFFILGCGDLKPFCLLPFPLVKCRSLMMSRYAECFWLCIFCMSVCFFFMCVCVCVCVCVSPPSEYSLWGYFAALMVWCINLQRPPLLWTEEKHTDMHTLFWATGRLTAVLIDRQRCVCVCVCVCFKERRRGRDDSRYA